MDACVSCGPGVRNGSCVCSLPASVKIYYSLNIAQKRTTNQFIRILCSEILMNSSPRPLFHSSTLPPPPLPSRSASARPCGVGAGRRFCGALWMNGYPAVPECGMEVVFVRCRQLLKYIIYEILHHKGRNARALASFAVRYQ